MPKSYSSDTNSLLSENTLASALDVDEQADSRSLISRNETLLNKNSKKYMHLKSCKHRKRHSHKGFLAFVRRVLKSNPSQYRLIKAILCFPFGLLVANTLFLVVVQPMDLDPDLCIIIRKSAGLIIAIAFAISVRIRCIMLLVIPIFFGKMGRSFIAAFAVILLVSGPIENIISNCREVTRSLTCLTQLLKNHTLVKWKLRLSPIKSILEEILEESFMVGRISQSVKSAFAPIVKEVEDKTEVEEMEEELKEVQQIVEESEKHSPSDDNVFSLEEVEKKHEVRNSMNTAQALQEQWEKKLDLRCNDVFGKAVLRCREWFGDLWDKCLEALWILGYVLCVPLKMSFFCQLVKFIPGVLGFGCDSMNVVEPGLGETYLATKDMINEIVNGMKIKLQYRLNLTPDSSSSQAITTAEEIQARAIFEFESKVRWIRMLMAVAKRLVAMSFLLVFRVAYKYHSGYLAKYQHDNVYVTSYFRR